MADELKPGEVPPCPFTRLSCDFLDRDYDPQEAGWRIHDFPQQPAHCAYWIAGGLEEDEAKFIVWAVNSAHTLTAQLAAKEAALQEAREALVEAAVPLEGLNASREWVDLAPNTWAEIENGIRCVRAFLRPAPDDTPPQ